MAVLIVSISLAPSTNTGWTMSLRMRPPLHESAQQNWCPLSACASIRIQTPETVEIDDVWFPQLPPFTAKYPTIGIVKTRDVPLEGVGTGM